AESLECAPVGLVDLGTGDRGDAQQGPESLDRGVVAHVPERSGLECSQRADRVTTGGSLLRVWSEAARGSSPTRPDRNLHQLRRDSGIRRSAVAPTAEQTAKSRGQSTRRRARPGDEAGVIPILARAAREVESAVQKGPLKPASRTRFQVAALLLREEKERVKQDATLSEADRQGEQKRLDGLPGLLAKTAARDTSLMGLLGPDAPITPAAKALRRQMLLDAGVELAPDELLIVEEPKQVDAQAAKQVVPASVRQMQMANPFLAPDLG